MATLSTSLFIGCAAPTDGELATSSETEPLLANAQSVKLDVNDVSFLFALPKPSETADLLLKLSDKAAFGDLLSRAVFKQALALIKGHQAPAYENWRVVAFRFDSCAKPTLDAPECHVTMRLVLQPVTKSGAKFTTEDHTLHVVYEVPATDGPAIVNELVALKSLSPVSTNGLPLGVHPGFAAGLNGAFANRLKQTILSHVGTKNITFVTAMLTNSSDRWPFAASRMKNGNLEQLVIPTVNSKVVTFDETSTFPALRAGLIEPASLVPDHVAPFLSTTATNALSASDLARFVDAAARIQNPLQHDVFTTDCVSCHMAERGMMLANRLRHASTDGNPNAFVAPTGTTARHASQITDETYVVKAFAYHLDQTSIIQRTANESAHVAGLINNTFLK